MNTKQLTYPSIESQKQFWIDKEAQSDNATTETREASGSASINIDKSGNTITITHGETGDLLLKREVTKEFWEVHLWPLLEGKRP